MDKIIQKTIKGLDIIIAINNSKELKIGSQEDLIEGRMSAFEPSDNCWYGVGLDLLHTGVNNDEIFCNIGSDLPVDNSEFPHEFLSLADIDKINKARDFKY